MATYLWLDYENRIWFGLILKELAQGASEPKTYLSTFLETEWLITEFNSSKYGYVKKQAVSVDDQFNLFKLLSGLFEDMPFRTLQKLTTKLVNAFVFDYSAIGLSFAQPHCLSVLYAERNVPILDENTINLNELGNRRNLIYAE